MTQKISTKSSYPKNIHFFDSPPPPPNSEIKKFEPKKMSRAYVCMKISEYPPPPSLNASVPFFALLVQG